MGQIKHLIYACLIIIVSFVAYTTLSSFSDVTIIKEKEAVELWRGTTTLVETPVNAEGKRLFQQHCQTCHGINKNFTGPALKGFTQRGPWTKRENIYKWIKNPAAFMSTNKYTQGLKQKYGVIR